MKLPKTIFLLFTLFFSLLTFSGCGCNHTWIEATCTTPATCSECGETEGEPTGHTWQGATCTTPKTCSICNTTEGTVLEHNWIDATCTEPQICNTCGITDGEPIGHKAGEWILTNEANVLEDGIKQQYCSSCDKLINTKTYTLETFCKNGKFIFSPHEFIERLKPIAIDLYSDLNVSLKSSSDSLTGLITENNDAAAVMIFSNSDVTLTEDNEYSNGIDQIIMTTNSSASTEAQSYAMMSVVMTCDPQLNKDDTFKLISKLLQSLIDSGYERGIVEKNGIEYRAVEFEELIIMTITVL